MSSDKNHYLRWLGTYSGKKLLETHKLSDEGTWQVHGEDPNCDLGGHHHEPFLGVYSGRLEDVIRMAVELPGFWQWGGGGRIEPANANHRVKRVARPETDAEQRVRLMGDAASKRRAISDRIREIETELAGLKKAEQEAIAAEAEEAEIARIKAAALSKLTARERKALGLK